MSAGEQRAATSFGDPNARPPTPQRTPTAVSLSTLPQTPKQTCSHFDEPSGWTPRFAEEYSVFNSTPGNLRGNSGTATFSNNSLVDFAPLSPVPPSTGKKRPLSAEVVAVDIAAHVNPSTAGSATFAPLRPVRQLPSSPEPLTTATHEDAGTDSDGTAKGPQAQKQTKSTSQSPSLPHQQQQGQRSTKKPRKESFSAAGPGSSSKGTAAPPRTQTATPPPSSRGGRKLAPRLQMENMQSQSFGRADYSGAAQPQQPHLNTSFVAGNPDDVFGYAMGPATAPPITEPRPFWGMDMNTSGMSIDVDLSAAGADLFQTTPTHNPQHRSLNSIDWGRANQVFQQTGMVAQPQQDQQQHQQQPSNPQRQVQERRQSQPAPARRDRPLAPKTAAMSTPSFAQTTPSQTFSFESFQMSMDDPFGTSPGGVDPGLLFGQPVTSAASMDPMSMSMPLNAASQRPTSSATGNMVQTTAGMGREPAFANPSAATGNDPRSGGTSQGQQRRLSERPSNIISPTKNGGSRPGLSRSFSENARGGKRNVGGGKNPLPALAPARPATVHQPSLPPPPGNPNSRPQSQSGRSGGRSSPLKSSHHHRLSSLTSIPENAANFPSRSRSRSAKTTSVKFVIDENGRARTETVRDDSADDDDAPEPLFSNINQQGASRNSWAGVLPTQAAVSDEEYSSSSDDEPIIIPSRNTSFSYPEPPRGLGTGTSRPPTASSLLSQSRVHHRSSSDRYSSTSSSFRRVLPDDAEISDDMEVDALPRSQGSSGRPSTGGSLGDAAAELRKVMQGVNPRRSSSNPNPQLLLGSGSNRQRLTPGQRSSSSTISEASLPGASPTHLDQIRCVCNRPEAEADGVQFLVKCDSCECLLHGRCVDVPTPQDVPHVYICAFCANTPNMRGGRMRYTGRTTAGAGGNGLIMGPPVTSASAAAAAAVASSPLAHKSFRSFR